MLIENGHNFEALRRHILDLSVSNKWDDARREWRFIYSVQLNPEDSYALEICPCGHHPIMELCYLENVNNRNLTFVGNVCVNRFMGLKVDTIIQGLERVRTDKNRALNEAAIVFALERHLISEWEYKFLLNTRHKKNLSQKQILKRIAVNEKVVRGLRQLRQFTQLRQRVAASLASLKTARVKTASGFGA
jgi:hypothetical protein